MRLLAFLGNRRPASLRDVGEYAEAVSRPPALPVAHDDGPGIEGHHIGRRNMPPVGRHRADK